MRLFSSARRRGDAATRGFGPSAATRLRATDPTDRYRILTRDIRPTPRRMLDDPLNRRARGRRADRSSRRRRSERRGFRSWPLRTAGRGLGSLSRWGDGVDQAVVAALVAVGCAVQGRQSAPPEPGMNRRRRWETRERDGRVPRQRGCAGGARWRRRRRPCRGGRGPLPSTTAPAAERVDVGSDLYGGSSVRGDPEDQRRGRSGCTAGGEHGFGHMRFGREWLRTENQVADRCRAGTRAGRVAVADAPRQA